MPPEDDDWNPWMVKQIHPSDSLVDKFQSWDSAAAKPRLKAWNRAKQWLSTIIRHPFNPPIGHELRVNDRDKAFLYLTEEMSKNVSFSDFLKSSMIPPTKPDSVAISASNPQGDASGSHEITKSEEETKYETLSSNSLAGQIFCFKTNTK